jgi:hypothetical protein
MTQDSVASAEARALPDELRGGAARAGRVVRQLESGEVPLDESISLYERVKSCVAPVRPGWMPPRRGSSDRGGGRWLAAARPLDPA